MLKDVTLTSCLLSCEVNRAVYTAQYIHISRLCSKSLRVFVSCNPSYFECLTIFLKFCIFLLIYFTFIPGSRQKNIL